MPYAGVLFAHARVNQKARKEQQKWLLPTELPQVSLVIAFRNEEKNLLSLLNSLAGQDYPHADLEIILVDDHSTDRGFQVLSDALPAENRFVIQLHQSPPQSAGKKDAIAFGVAQSRSELILMSDADVQFSSHWVRNMVLVHMQTQADMVCGSVQIVPKKWVEHAEAIEFSALIAVAAAGIEAGKPNLSNGANLLVRKSVFTEAQSARKDSGIASGDDVFLMHHLQRLGKKIRFCHLENSAVSIAAQTSWATFENQRIRWASKWNSGIPGSKRFAAIAVWAFYLVFLLVFFGLGSTRSWMPLCILLAVKTAAETHFLLPFLFKSGFGKNSIRIALMQIPYAYYVVYFGIRVLCARQYVWKGRNIRL